MVYWMMITCQSKCCTNAAKLLIKHKCIRYFLIHIRHVSTWQKKILIQMFQYYIYTDNHVFGLYSMLLQRRHDYCTDILIYKKHMSIENKRCKIEQDMLSYLVSRGVCILSWNSVFQIITCSYFLEALNRKMRKM